MTDEQIIKGLECLASEKDVLCAGCEYRHFEGYTCHDENAKDAIALIQQKKAEIERLSVENERLKAENERLTSENERLTAERDEARRDCAVAERNHALAVEERVANVKGFTEQLKTARADAVRDVIRRVLGEAITIQDHRGNLGSVVTANDVERIAKEMTEGEG